MSAEQAAFERGFVAGLAFRGRAPALKVRNEYDPPAIHSTLTKEGIARAKAAGKHCGRPPKCTPAQIKDALELIRNGATVACVARVFKVSRATVIYWRDN